MKLINKATGETIAEVMTNHSMSIEDALRLMDFGVNDDGQLIENESGKLLQAFYDDLEMVW